MPQKNLEPCRNCKSQIESKLRRCPYCGILNPTVKTKDILITTFIIIVVMFIYTLTIK
jgi:RNA polymerase subunit RPABC4/transcription elongation factor Spt4